MCTCSALLGKESREGASVCIYTDPETDGIYTADAGQGWFGGQAYGDPGMYEHPGALFWGPTQQVVSLTAFAL